MSRACEEAGPIARARNYTARLTRACTLLHASVSVGFAVSLLAGVWSGWLGRGFQVCAWGIGISVTLLLGVAAAGFLDQMRRGFCAARLLRRPPGVRFGLLGLVTITVAAGMWTLSQRLAPGENLLGNHDQGMYLGTALHLAKTGRFRIDLAGFGSYPAETRNLLLRRDPVQAEAEGEPFRRAYCAGWRKSVGAAALPSPEKTIQPNMSTPEKTISEPAATSGSTPGLPPSMM